MLLVLVVPIVRNVEKLVLEAIGMYNRYREPEAHAELVSINMVSGEFTIKFQGSFVTTCGLYDWIEDLRYILEELGLNVVLEKVIEPENPLENWRIAIFRVR